MTSGVTSASSGSLVDPEPRSATQSPTLWESNHLLSSTLECGKFINSSAVGAHARKYKKPPSSRLQQNTKQKIIEIVANWMILTELKKENERDKHPK